MVQDNNYDSTVADIRLAWGDQGSGKTCSSVAMVVEDCYAHLDGILNVKSGEVYKARPLNGDEIALLQKKRIAYHPLKHMRIFSNTSKDSKIIDKTSSAWGNNWVITSPVRVFANFHFYGIRAEFIGIVDIIENINSDRFTNGWLVFDENTGTDKRETMSAEGKMNASFAAQVRRRKLHMVIIAQTLNMIQSRFVLFSTTRVECKYDKETHMIDLEVNEKSPFMQSTSYYAPDYWKFYKHDEIVKVPQHKVDNLMAKINNAG